MPSGTLWATENIKDENGNELYFAWGETQGYTLGQVGTDKNFSWEDYKFGPDTAITKYNETDGLTVLEPEDDAATVNWGEGWRMPTKEEFEELLANTEYEWTEVDGVQGAKFTSKVDGYTDKFLFFPAVGFVERGNFINHTAIYRISSLGTNKISTYTLNCNAQNNYGIVGYYRFIGVTVRPVHN